MLKTEFIGSLKEGALIFFKRTDFPDTPYYVGPRNKDYNQLVHFYSQEQYQNSEEPGFHTQDYSLVWVVMRD